MKLVAYALILRTSRGASDGRRLQSGRPGPTRWTVCEKMKSFSQPDKSFRILFFFSPSGTMNHAERRQRPVQREVLKFIWIKNIFRCFLSPSTRCCCCWKAHLCHVCVHVVFPPPYPTDLHTVLDSPYGESIVERYLLAGRLI